MIDLKEKYKKEFSNWYLQNEYDEVYKKYEFVDWLIEIKGKELGYVDDTYFMKKWPEAEPYIKTNAKYAYWYAYVIISGRWLEAEEYIKKDPVHAFDYAKYVIKGRWPDAEEYIKTDFIHGYLYAKFIIKDRWLEAEEYIKKVPIFWDKYKAEFNIND